MSASRFCNTDPKTPEAIRAELDRIEGALGGYAATDSNPCGGAAYCDDGEEKPWKILFCDGASEESFSTADEAVQAAKDYADEMDAE